MNKMGKKIMKVFVLILFFTTLLVSNLFAKDDDPILLKINGREITLSEFEYIYTKNNLNTQVIDPKTIDEYLELFINFNLKVKEAIELGLDTHQTFITELAGYRKQLAQPYLNDQNVTNELIEEALERAKYDIRASHILFTLDEHATPKDTLEAWKKIINIRNRILAGENFGEMARTYSDDQSAKGMPATPNRGPVRANLGDLPYFSVLDMVYPFETAAYNTPLNQISMPVRTNYGYHIIKVTERQPAMGRARVAHIMINAAVDAPEEQLSQAKDKIDEIYQKLLTGAEFDTLVQRHSDDKASARRNGELPPFTSNRMVPEFIKVISTLNEPGAISQPVKTQFGWHIVKLIEKSVPSDEEAIAELRNRISRDSRANLSQKSVIERIKKEYGFVGFDENIQPFYSLVDESIFQGSWARDENISLGMNLFKIGETPYTQNDFAEYLTGNQTMRSPEAIVNFVNRRYADFQKKMILDYEEDRLELKYPEFRKIMQEYHDGILLFELTDQKVWSKAMQDTTGLQEFYEANLKNYMWNDRIDGVIYTFDSEQLAKSSRNKIRRIQRRKLSHDDLIKEINKDSQLLVSAEKGLFEKQEKPLLADVKWEKGVSPVISWKGGHYIVQVNNVLPVQPKKLNEIRGLVIADYQNQLEQQWIQELRQKYNFTVNAGALKKLDIE